MKYNSQGGYVQCTRHKTTGLFFVRRLTGGRRGGIASTLMYLTGGCSRQDSRLDFEGFGSLIVRGSQPACYHMDPIRATHRLPQTVAFGLPLPRSLALIGTVFPDCSRPHTGLDGRSYNLPRTRRTCGGES